MRHKTVLLLILFLSNIIFAQNLLENPKNSLLKANQFLNKGSHIFADSSHSFDVIKYYLKLNVPMTNREYSGNVKISFKSNEANLTNIRFHSLYLEIDSVLFSDPESTDPTWDKISHSIIPGFLSIDLSSPLINNENGIVDIYYRYTNSDNIGFFYNDKNAFTLSEPWDARYWMPCFDEPWDKATWECEITVPEMYKVASNGILIEEIANPDNTITYHWKEDHFLTTYLMAFSISDYTVATDWYVADGDSIPILNYIFPEDSAAAAFDLRNIAEMMELYVQLFDEPYPYDKYGHMEMRGWGGGMEHTSITTMSESWINGHGGAEGGFAHELVHMWFGDLVTCLDFRNIWLNESFATYYTGEWFRYKYGEDSFINYLNGMEQAVFNADAGFRYAIYDPPYEYIFGTNEYQKGAWVLHMLRNIVGDDVFWNITREHLNRFKWGNINTEDFILLCEELSGLNLRWFFDQWLFDIGLPEIEYDWTSQSVGGSYKVDLNLSQVQEEGPTFHLLLEIGILLENGTMQIEDIVFNKRSDDFTFTVDEQPKNIIIDPNYKVLKKRHLTTPVPDDFKLFQPFPNPCVQSEIPEIGVKYYIPVKTDVKITFYNILGQEVKEFYVYDQPAGIYIKRWDLTNDFYFELSSGVYFVKMETPRFKDVKKFVFIK
ncbi:M1 family aminopeptidase [candidate division KSB1 bacterium]